MSCDICKNSVGKSYDKNPFVPPNGSCDDAKYICYQCGQIWFQMNVRFHIWQPATPEEWIIWRKELRKRP